MKTPTEATRAILEAIANRPPEEQAPAVEALISARDAEFEALISRAIERITKSLNVPEAVKVDHSSAAAARAHEEIRR